MANSSLVYSTDGGRAPAAKKYKAQRRLGPSGPARPARPVGPVLPQAPADGWLRIWRVKGGRGGKVATVITGIPASDDLDGLAVALRRAIGADGGVRDGAIEVQGEHRERVQQWLAQRGYRVKLAGG